MTRLSSFSWTFEAQQSGHEDENGLGSALPVRVPYRHIATQIQPRPEIVEYSIWRSRVLGATLRSLFVIPITTIDIQRRTRDGMASQKSENGRHDQASLWQVDCGTCALLHTLLLAGERGVNQSAEQNKAFLSTACVWTRNTISFTICLLAVDAWVGWTE